jgi:hypothetical protein
MKKILFFSLFLLLARAALAQDAPKAGSTPIPSPAAPKDAPAEITIPAAEAKAIQEKSLAAENATLKAENYQLQIQAEISKARAELNRLSEIAKKATDESNSIYTAALVKAGIAADRAGEYAAEPQPDGTIKVRRKPATPPQPAPPVK